MSSEPKNLPFEPKKNRKKPKSEKQPPVTSPTINSEEKTSVKREQMVIPDAVGKRMIARMVVLSGIPTAIGVIIFVGSYFVIINHWFDLPHIVTVLLSMGFFGLGVLGLSYGVISASWDEDEPGSLIGWDEFTTNFGRLTSAWRSAREQKN
jgi:Photosynthesis affected mutant 68